MNPAQLLDHFDCISEAPDAIPRLRRFILDLAVRGKLVEQDLKDEPASNMLKRIQAETTQLEDAIDPLAEDEQPFKIPQSWAWIRMAEAAHVEMGQSPPSENYNQSGNGIPFYQGKTDFGFRCPTPRYWCNLPSKLAQKNDILISVRAPVGPTNVASEECCIGRGLAALRPRHGVYLEFLLYSLKGFESAIAAMGYGTTFVAITKKQLVSFAVPLPPLTEQHRIVAKVDELMALCDRLEAAQTERESQRDRLAASSLQRLYQPAKESSAFREHARFALDNLPRLTTRPEHIQQIRQTILNLAVRGKLAPQDPKDEPATELLKRLHTEQEELIKARVLKPDGDDSRLLEEDLPCDIPSTWQWASLRSIIVFGPQNGISPKPSSRSGAPRAITLTATTSGKFNPQHFKRVDATIPPDSEFWLHSDDLLFQRGNTREYVGIAAYYTGEPRLFLYPDLMIKVRLSQKVSLRYVHLWAIAPPARAYFSTHASGAQATMPKINQGTLLQLPVPIPPLAEQGRIVAKVEELMALCDRLEAQLTTTQTESRSLLEAVLHDALAGQSELEQGALR